MGVPHFVYPFVIWWTLNCFQYLAIVKNTAMNISVQIIVYMFSFLLDTQQKSPKEVKAATTSVILWPQKTGAVARTTGNRKMLLTVTSTNMLSS